MKHFTGTASATGCNLKSNDVDRDMNFYLMVGDSTLSKKYNWPKYLMM